MIFKHYAFAYGTRDASFSSNANSIQYKSNINMLNKVSSVNYASLELDSYDIDNPRIMYSNENLALATNTQSDSNGEFANSIYITAKFSSAVSFSGIAIDSVNEVIAISVETKLGGILKSNNDIGIDNRLQFGKTTFYFKPINKSDFTDVDEVVITFRKIAANRFLNVSGISFGRIFCFDEDTIKSPKMINQFSVSGRELPIDSLEFTLFNIPEDLLLDNNQKVEVLDEYNEVKYTFYVNGWEYDENSETVKITYNDVVSLLEEQYVGGYYVNKTVKSIVSDILEDTDLTCQMSTEVEETTLSGFIPVTTKRNALIYIANATGYKILKHPELRIFRPRDYDYANFNDENIFLGTIKKTIEKPSKEVDLSLFTFEEEFKEDEQIIYEGDFKIGDYEIIFKQPISRTDLLEKDFEYRTTVTGAIDASTIKLSNNSCKFKVVKDSHLTFIAHSFLVSKSTIIKMQIDNAELYRNHAIQTIDSFTLMRDDYQSRLKELFDYYKKNETIAAKVLWSNPQMDGFVTFYGERKQVKKITNSFNAAVEIEVE